MSKKNNNPGQVITQADELLLEYDKLISTVTELKQRARVLYRQLKENEDTKGVAQTLEHILHLPE
ncbi:MAG: hypothetical protein KBD29_01750 [Candidatus Magasanikbacteria bacterium]|nr:hypothetical protein [Candidatus Magasanikbacteria bacterium]